MRKYVKNHGIIFGGPQNFVGFSTGPWTGKGWETLHYSNPTHYAALYTFYKNTFMCLKLLYDDVRLKRDVEVEAYASG
jgi:hypothetical protein